jgi:uncharacterized protein YbjT (DUF2867 family)
MDVVVAGGHGRIARHLERMLSARGDRVRGLIRNPAHADDLRAAGAEPVLCDLEAADLDEVARAVDGADAIVFAAGAGPGSGARRKLTIDRDGAILTIAAARRAGVPRYLMVSAMGARHPPPDKDDVFSIYLRAKAEADAALTDSPLAWTIVRPGLLTDDPGTGRVLAAPSVPRGEVPREDVAAVLAEVLVQPATTGVTFEVVAGDEPIEQAVAALTAGPAG